VATYMGPWSGRNIGTYVSIWKIICRVRYGRLNLSPQRVWQTFRHLLIAASRLLTSRDDQCIIGRFILPIEGVALEDHPHANTPWNAISP
jgi:hypothetical protein